MLLRTFRQGVVLLAFFVSWKVCQASPGPEPKSLPVTHAKGFSIQYEEGVKHVTVHQPWRDAGRPVRYVLYRRGEAQPDILDGIAIPIPIESCAVLSSTYISQIDLLGQARSIRAVDHAGYIYTASVQERIQSGHIAEIGDVMHLNMERLIALSPQVVFSYALNNNDENRRTKLQAAGIQTILAASYLENSPLGRAEWIKFVGAFYDKEEEASKAFAVMEQEYLDICKTVSAITNRPSVLASAPFKGTWHVPGGQSYSAALIQDAGGTYLWENNSSNGGIPISMEEVFSRAIDADIWINPSSWGSLEDGRKQDQRFSAFKAFRAGKVYNNNKRVNKQGGNDFWESGVIQPQVVLKDLVSIFHPELFPAYERVYFQQLK
jgi:iron complex transport system substrate-binding protein